LLFFPLAVLPVASARADYDMSGKWLVVVSGLTSHWEVTQSPGTLSVDRSDYPPPGTVPGTIDDGTGAFELAMPQPFPSCGTNTLNGNVAADGKSFLATEVVHTYILGFPIGTPGHCETATNTLNGTRCGNELLDAGEECDDGNPYTGDCCSPSCTLDAAGTGCTTDNDVCTDDVCDGAGLCQHVDNTAPCQDQHGCGSGNCAGGACVFSAPAPSGTSCDLDGSVCTPDSCDGAGSCAAAPAIDCAPCGYCDAFAGCVGDGGVGCDGAVFGITESLRADDANGKRLRVTFSDVFSAPNLGDPTSATEYTLCLYERPEIGPDTILSTIVIPAGGTCGDGDCWKVRGDAFLYRDRTAGADGISSMRVDPYQIKIVGKRAPLPLPAQFPANPVTISPKLIASDGVTSYCWYHTIKRDLQTPIRFKGHYSSAEVE
jgi:cysteine-rich repeat protein